MYIIVEPLYVMDSICFNKSVSQSCAVAKREIFWRAFVAASRLFAKFDCPVARQNICLLATAHDCEIGLFENPPGMSYPANAVPLFYSPGF